MTHASGLGSQMPGVRLLSRLHSFYLPFISALTVKALAIICLAIFCRNMCHAIFCRNMCHFIVQVAFFTLNIVSDVIHDVLYVIDCQLDSSQSKLIVFLSTQDSVEFHYQLLSDCLCGNTDDTRLHTVQLFKLHGDLPQKVNPLCHRL